MAYIIFGAGAVGTSLAAQFNEAGIDNILVARGSQLDHLRQHGLSYERAQGSSRIDLRVTDLAGLRLGPGDVLLLAVKTQDVEALSSQIAILPVTGGGLGRDLPVVTLQNGLEAERIVQRRFARTYAAVVRVPAVYTETGKVRVLAKPQFASFVLGRTPGGTDRLTAGLTADLTRANTLAEERDDILRWKAQKLVYNVRNVVELFQATPEEAGRVGQALSDEAARVLTAAGLPQAQEHERRVSLSGWSVARDPGRPDGQSTWQSFTRGASSEVDFLNGEIVLQARRHGLEAPWNSAAQEIAARLAAGRLPPGVVPLAELVERAQGPAAALSAIAS